MPKKAVQEAEPREDADNTPAAFGDNAKPLLVEYVHTIVTGKVLPVCVW